MTVAAALALIEQLMALYPTLEPAFVNGFKDLQGLFAGGNEPSQADIDALISRVQSQSAAIQAEN